MNLETIVSIFFIIFDEFRCRVLFETKQDYLDYLEEYEDCLREEGCSERDIKLQLEMIKYELE